MLTANRSSPKRAWNKLPILLIPLAITTAWTANGCGTNVNTQSVRLDVAFDRTGSLQSDGLFVPMTANKTVSLGDTGFNVAERGFVSVTLAAIPSGANVIKVVLRLAQEAPFGNPFDDFGTLSVDHVDVVAGITAADFLANPITSSIATIPPLPTDGSTPIAELDVTNHVKADIAAGRPISSFRLVFLNAPSVDFETDRAFFTADPDFPALQPFATVTYQQP
jgi:hypothetical protein